MIDSQTIVALSSSAGAAARAIVRLSGGMARQIAEAIADATLPPGRAQGCLLVVQSWKVTGTIYFFREPRSYTGEDLVEFHVPDNALVCERLIGTCVQKGARRAEPGEFTARAFFNGKMDLTQAEGVAATIGALNQRQLDAARQLMSGELTRRLATIMALVVETLALLEAGIDFVDEEIRFITDEDLRRRLDRASGMLIDLVEQSGRFGRLGGEPVGVLVGRPNAGKSTLLNALAGAERAIISPAAGTTRDALSAEIVMSHGMVRIVDVAGIVESTTGGEIDRQMQARAREVAAAADFVISVVESGDHLPATDVGRPADIQVRSKIDLGGKTGTGEIGISAHSGEGLEQLRCAVDELCFTREDIRAALSLNARHIQEISSARCGLLAARESLSGGHEFVALHLRETLDHFGLITGQISPDDLLGKIFAHFCIGK